MIQRFTLQEDEGGFIINYRQVPVLDEGKPVYIDQEGMIPQRKNEVAGVEMYVETSEKEVYKRIFIPRKELVALFKKMKEIERQELEYVQNKAA